MGLQETDCGNLRATEFAEKETRLPLDITHVSKTKGRCEPALGKRRVDGFRVWLVDDNIPWLLSFTLGSGREMAHRWRALQTLPTQVGLVPIFLLSDVHPCGGGTALLRGSHKKVAGLLWERSGTTGLTGPELSNAARDALLPPAAAEDVVETRGSAGDVMLTHPLLLHARSKNLARVDPSGVRFMCHPAVPLKKHLDFQADPETFSPVQRTLWQSRPLSGINGPAPIVDPQDCDHSAVAFPSGEAHKKRKWKRGTTTGERGKAAETACDDKARGGSSSLKEVIKDGSKLHLIDDSGCHGGTSEMSNEAREASTPQPASDGEKRAVGDAPQPPFEGVNDAQSIDSHEAVSPTGNDYEEDEEVLATMGFSGFGHST